MTPAIRPAVVADASAIAAIYSRYVTEGYASFEGSPPTAAEFERRMTDRPLLPWLVAADDTGAVVGFAYASRHRARAAYRWAVDCSVYLAPGTIGRGTGRTLYERLIPEIRALGYVTAFAGIALPNPASVALHQAMGFRPVGVYRNVGYKAGQWRDVGWWQLPLCDPPASPPEPQEWRPA